MMDHTNDLLEQINKKDKIIKDLEISILEQINKKDNIIKDLEISLKHWQRNANDTMERLNRVYQNRNTPNYVDAFYDNSYRHLIEKLTKENILISDKTNIEDVRVVKMQKEQITDLRFRLNESNRRVNELENDYNKLLENQSDNIITDLIEKNEILQKENRRYRELNKDLRERYNVQQDLVNCVRSEFRKQRKEFMSIFLKNYQKGNEVFIEQLKSLDVETQNIPKFLLKPLSVDVGCSCDIPMHDEVDIVPVDEMDCLSAPPKDPLKDSGVDTLPEELREKINFDHVQELNEANDKIKRMEKEKEKSDEELKRRKENEVRYQRQMEELLTENHKLHSTVEEERSQRTKFENEVKTYETICSMYGSTIGMQSTPHQTPHASRVRGPSVSSSSCAQNPFKLNQNPNQPIMVRDGGLSTAESKENTLLTARGPLPASSHSSPQGSTHTSPYNSPYSSPHSSQEGPSRSSSSDNYARHVSQSRKEPTETSGWTECTVCKKPIEIDSYATHTMLCKKKPQ